MKANGEEWRREEARVVVKVEVEVKMKPFDCPIGNGIVSRDTSHDIQFDVHFEKKESEGKKSQHESEQKEHQKRPVHALALHGAADCRSSLLLPIRKFWSFSSPLLLLLLLPLFFTTATTTTSLSLLELSY